MNPPISLRPATSEDAPAIRSLISRVNINPMGLDWRRFVLAVDPDGKMVGCGQVKPHGDGTRELASIAVEPEWRGRGVARVLIEHLIQSNPGTLYLTCRAPLGKLYEKFGFRPVSPAEMTPYYRRLYRLVRLFSRMRQVELLVMVRD